MTSEEQSQESQLVRELNYYRREYNDLGARALRLQEEQSRAFREARRSRTVARLIREAYGLVDRAATPEQIGNLMLEIVVENTSCERAAILRRLPGEGRFAVTHALGFGGAPAPVLQAVPSPPDFFFTTAESKLEAPAYELTEILRVPFILWAFDAGSGYALIIGNQSEGNINRPFEKGDQELIEGALSVYIDIVLRKQAEVELRAAKSEAEEAGRSKSKFLAILSHELRTPLNAILGFSDMLRSDPSEYIRMKLQEYAGDIHQAGSYLLSLINDILDYSELERVAPTLHEERVDLIDLLVHAADGVKLLSSQKGIEVSVDVVHRIPSVSLDPKRMTQVLMNLLTNGIKFSPEGSQVRISARVSNSDRSLLVEVEDHGIGIGEEDMRRAFEPFVQLGDSYRNPVKGTGLGLAIARSLVEAHGGTLTLRSQSGKGTVATVQLPSWRLNDDVAAPQ
jgi:signal transduction histidine kinase